MRNDPHIVINTELSTAWARTREFVARHLKALAAVWFLTNLLSTVAYLVLYPPWAGNGPSGTVGSFRYGIYALTTALIGAVGFVFVVHLTHAAAAGTQRSDYAAVIDESVRMLGRYIATAVLCFLRIILWGLMAVPILMLFSLFGLGAYATPFTAFLFSAPVTLLMVLAFVRFGWGLYFTIINGDTPLYAMYHGQSMYLNNRRITWALAVVVFLIPGLMPLFDIYDIGGLGYYVHPAAYLASAWTYVVSAFATMVLFHAEAGAD